MENRGIILKQKNTIENLKGIRKCVIKTPKILL
jgi:hypothetical protein